MALENIVRNGEIDCNKQFLLFSQCFLPYMALIFHFKMHFEMSYVICFSLDQSKILSSGNGLTLSQTTNFRHFQTERLCRRQFLNLMKMAESSPSGQKTLWEKEKLLVTSNFSFSHSVFKRLVLQTRKNQGLFGKGLNRYTFWEKEKIHFFLFPEFLNKPHDLSEFKTSAFDK